MEQKDPTPLQDETIIEEKNIEKQEEAPVSSNDKKTNKVKKPVTRKRTMITSIIISVISCLVGGFGGYVLYSGLNPEEDPIVIEKGNTFYDVQAIEASLEEGTFISLYQEKLQDPLNYMLDQFVSQTPYTLVIGKGVVHAAAGVEQSILSANYCSPEGFYVEKISDSSLVHTADRYYDDALSMNIKAYEAKYPTDWEKGIEPKDYTYDQYIQAFGKLNTGLYYCLDKSDVSEEEPIPDKFLTLSKEEYEQSQETGKRVRNGLITYTLSKNTIQSGTIEKRENGYFFHVDLNVPAGVSFTTVQMKSTGRLKARPSFTSCFLEFETDLSLNLIRSLFHDEYRVNTGGLVTNATSDLNQQYFKSETSLFQTGAKEVNVSRPDPKALDFNGYELWREE